MSALSQNNTNSNVEINVGPYDSGNSVYTGTLSVNGNLAVSGNVSYVTELNVNDAFIQVASNNTGAVTSMGLVATKTANTFAGLRWNTTVGSWQTSTSTGSDGTPVAAYSNIVNSAAGSNTQIQFNDGGVDFGASANLTFNKTTNILTVTGTSSTTGNVVAGNVNTAGLVTATGNVTGGNINTAGVASVTSNVIAGNLTTVGQVSATGNINTSGYYVGNGYYLTSVSAASSNASQIVGNTLSSNVLFSSLTSVGTLTSLSVSGNTTTGNLATGGLVTATGNVNTAAGVLATGNIRAGNVLSVALIQGATLSSTGNVISGNLNAAGLSLSGNVLSNLSVTSNIAGGNILTPGLINATGNISGGNISTGGLVTATGNITGGNLLTAGLVSATGNVTGGNVNTNTIVGTALTLRSTGALNLSSTGNVVLTANTVINNVAEPQQSTDAATKNYVDSVSQGLNVHDATKVATPDTLANITGGTITYNNGTSGVGATLTTTGSFNLIDTVNVQTAGTRIMVKNEANAVTNGVYVWSNATVITRATDYDSVPEVEAGDFIFVSSGNVYGNTGWVQTSTVTGIGTTGNNIVFTQFSGQGTYTAGTGLTLTGTTFSVNASQTQITAVGTLGSLSVAGNTVSGNLSTAGLVTATGNVTGGNVNTAGVVTATGNVTGANFNTAGLVTATGNVTGGNVNTAGVVTATGNITGGNLNATGLSLSGNVVSALNVTANVAAGNLRTVGQVSATGNITTAAYFIGDGSFISNAAFAGIQIQNGTSNAKIPVSNGNIEVTVGGVANVGVFTTTGLVVTSNVTAGNFVGTLSGNVTATGNITGGNLTTTGNVSASGNLNAAGLSLSGNVLSAINSTSNITTSGNISGSWFLGNISAVTNGTSSLQISTANGNANVSIGGTSNVLVVTTAGSFVTGIASASGNVIGGNLTTAGLITATGNITGANIVTTGLITATGNITGGNVSATNYTGTTVSVSGNVTGANINTAGVVSSTGNVLGANFVSRYTDGTALSLVGSTPSAANTAGGAVSIVAGTATSAGVSSAGGAINLTAGAGHSASNVGTGGAINITAGAGTGNAAGGLTTIRGGNSGIALSASLLLYGGNADGLQTAGNAQLSGGALTAGTDEQGGWLTLAAGAGTGAGTASKVVIKAPTVTTSGTSVQTVSNVAVFDSTGISVTGIVSASGNIVSGGQLINVPSGQLNANNVTTYYFTSYTEANVANITSRYTDGTVLNIRGGNTLTANAIGGNINISAGTGNNTAGGGLIFINGGDSGGTNAPGGNVEINGGRGSGTAFGSQGGFIKLTAGNSVAITNTGFGSYLTLNPGAASNSGGNGFLSGGQAKSGATDAAGGFIGIYGGTGTGAGQPGNIVFLVASKLASGTSTQTPSTRLTISDTQANITFSTTSTSTTTGALVVGGGVGVAGNIYSGYLSTSGNIDSGTSFNGGLYNSTVGFQGPFLSVTGNVNAGNVIASGLLSTNSITHTGTNAVGNIGSSSSYFNTVFAQATSALYADVAERYQADAFYWPGTVVVFGGANEITQSTESHDTRVAGVVSTNPAYLMNSGDTRANSTSVALLGRVPCKVVGIIAKGDLLATSNVPGVATKYNIDQYKPGVIVGKALEDYNSNDPGMIEVVIGRL